MSESASAEVLVPRPHQVEALNAMQIAEQEGIGRMVVEMATGLGKTLPAALYTKDILSRDPAARVLVACHRVGILKDLRRTFENVLGDDVSHSGLTGTSQDLDHQVLYGTLQTLRGRDMKTPAYKLYKPDSFGVVIGDECHHGPARTYRQIYDYFQPDYAMIGTTATPYRLDGRQVSSIFGPTVYQKTLPQGIREGLLTPFRYHTYTDKLPPPGKLRELAKTMSLKQLSRSIFIPRRDEEIVRIFAEELEQIQNPHGLIFCKTIAHAEHMSKIMARDLPYTVAPIHSKQPDGVHDLVTEAFESGELQLATVVGEYDEGRHVKGINFIGFCRETASEGRWLQNLGRGLAWEEDKPFITVADMTTSFNRIPAIHQLEREISESAPSQRRQYEPKNVKTRANFIFEEEVHELAMIAESVRARVQARQTAIAAEKAAKAERAAQIEEERQQSKTRFRPLVEALEAGLKQGRTIQSLFGHEQVYSSSVTCWQINCRRPADVEAYPSKNRQTKDVHAIFTISDDYEGGREAREEYFGLYGNGKIRKFTIPTRDHGYEPLFRRADDSINYELAHDITITEASDDEIRRIEALLNLGLSNGLDSSARTLETIPYQNETARKMGILCGRAIDELEWHRNRDYKTAYADIESRRILIDVKAQPAVDFPGATILENYVATISVSKAKEENDDTIVRDYDEFVLLHDGSIVKARVVDKMGREFSSPTGINGIVAYPPTGYYSAVTEPASLDELQPILDMIEDKLGPEPDWANINLHNVLDAALKAYSATPNLFTPRDGRLKLDNDRALLRGITYALILEKHIATVDELSKALGFKKNHIELSVKFATLPDLDERSAYARIELRRTLVQALPRKQ